MSEQNFYETTTMCPVCETLLPGQVKALNEAVYITRTCPEHGDFKGLVCSDLDWYRSLVEYDVPPIKPSYAQQPSLAGCPRDCGLCPAHRQKAGTVAIEISNHCNLACPVCLADNQGTFQLSVLEIVESVNLILKTQEYIDVLTLSGGEPTIHPELMAILDALEPLKIRRIVINSNGIRIAEDDLFLDQLSGRPKVYVCLHFDGSRADKIRGVTPAVQQMALARLARWRINCTPLVLAVAGVNDDELGTLATELLTGDPAIKTVMFSLLAQIGRGSATFDDDQSRRLTIPAALACIEKGSGGRIRKDDFIPLPMPNPLCVAIGYFLVEEKRLTPLISVAGKKRVADFLANSHFGEPDEAFEQFFRDVIYDIYANPDTFADADSLLKSLRGLLLELFPASRPAPSRDERRALAEKRIKTVYVMQFMDSWTFDSVRMSKCSCQHLLPGGRIIPSCGYYCYHRKFDQRFA